MNDPGTTKDNGLTIRGAALGLSLVVSAFLAVEAVGSTSHGWLGWLSLVPLLVSARYVAPLGAMTCGALWGGSLWLFSALVGDGAVAPTAMSLALLTAVPACYTLLGSLLTRSRFGFSPLLLGMGWVGVEYALAPLSLRFGLLTGAFASGSFLHVVSGILGYGFIAFVIAYANGLLLSLLTDVRITVPGPLYARVSADTGALVIPDVVAGCSIQGFPAARPRAPPVR